MRLTTVLRRLLGVTTDVRRGCTRCGRWPVGGLGESVVAPVAVRDE